MSSGKVQLYAVLVGATFLAIILLAPLLLSRVRASYLKRLNKFVKEKNWTSHEHLDFESHIGQYDHALLMDIDNIDKPLITFHETETAVTFFTSVEITYTSRNNKRYHYQNWILLRNDGWNFSPILAQKDSFWSRLMHKSEVAITPGFFPIRNRDNQDTNGILISCRNPNMPISHFDPIIFNMPSSFPTIEFRKETILFKADFGNNPERLEALADEALTFADLCSQLSRG